MAAHLAKTSEAVWQATHETARICECSAHLGENRPKFEAGCSGGHGIRPDSRVNSA